MDLRTKLIFAFVLASLGAMLALGAFSYDATRSLLRSIALRQLEAMAESKKQDLERAIVGWRDRVQLVTSRTSLRESLRSFKRDGDEAQLVRTEAILADAIRAAESLRGISIYGADGFFLASSGIDLGERERVRPAMFMWADEPVVYENVSLDPDEGLLVTLVSPVRIAGVLVGAAKVRLSAQELIDVTRDYTGLGETGETLMAMQTESGDALVLNPLRHGPADSAGRRIGPDQARDPILQAVQGIEATYEDGAYDYRGEEVWAATRYLEEFGWGVVVKVDVDEELAPIRELRETLIRLGLSLSAFAIVVATLFGFYVSGPIRELAEVAQRIRDGEHGLRAPTGGADEVGRLARTFNAMADELLSTEEAVEEARDEAGSAQRADEPPPSHATGPKG
ncbi:MAG: HAMP domain-containing protein [Myxococcales bacterium]|nr:HAMP domain-containing protein [Myxococcales bacterium]